MRCRNQHPVSPPSSDMRGCRLGDGPAVSVYEEGDDEDKHKKRLNDLRGRQRRACCCAGISLMSAIVVGVVLLFVIALVATFAYHYNEKHTELVNQYNDLVHRRDVATKGWEHRIDVATKEWEWCLVFPWTNQPVEKGKREACYQHKYVLDTLELEVINPDTIRPIHDSWVYAIDKIGVYFPVMGDYIPGCHGDMECHSQLRRTWESLIPQIGWIILGTLAVSALCIYGVCIPFGRQRMLQTQMKMEKIQYLSTMNGKRMGTQLIASHNHELDEALAKFKANLKAHEHSPAVVVHQKDGDIACV